MSKATVYEKNYARKKLQRLVEKIETAIDRHYDKKIYFSFQDIYQGLRKGAFYLRGTNNPKVKEATGRFHVCSNVARIDYFFDIPEYKSIKDKREYDIMIALLKKEHELIEEIIVLGGNSEILQALQQFSKRWDTWIKP